MLQFLLLLTGEENWDKVEYLCNHFHDDALKYAKSRFRGAKPQQFDAEDVVQESYLRIMKYLNRLDFSVGDTSLKSYLFSVIDHQMVNMLEKMPVEENIEDYTDTLESDEEYFGRLCMEQERNDVREAVEVLPLIYTATLRFRYYAEMSITEIADLMGVSENTVKSRIKRSKQMILEFLQRRMEQ